MRLLSCQLSSKALGTQVLTCHGNINLSPWRYFESWGWNKQHWKQGYRVGAQYLPTSSLLRNYISSLDFHPFSVDLPFSGWLPVSNVILKSRQDQLVTLQRFIFLIPTSQLENRETVQSVWFYFLSWYKYWELTGKLFGKRFGTLHRVELEAHKKEPINVYFKSIHFKNLSVELNFYI